MTTFVMEMVPIVFSSSTALSTSNSVSLASALCERPALFTRMSICVCVCDSGQVEIVCVWGPACTCKCVCVCVCVLVHKCKRRANKCMDDYSRILRMRGVTCFTYQAHVRSMS